MRPKKLASASVMVMENGKCFITFMGTGINVDGNIVEQAILDQQAQLKERIQELERVRIVLRERQQGLI